MPWKSGGEFAKKHWKKASPAQAAKARQIAEAMLRSGAAEGVAIPTAIKLAKRGKGKRGGKRVAGNPARAAAKRK